MNVVAVQSDAAKVSAEYIALLGDKLTITEDLDEAMRQTDILYVGRQPDEYEGESAAEKERSSNLKAAFAAWEVNRARLQQMRAGSIVMHPRPRRDELNPDVDQDKRMRDVPQMANMIPMRMAILALHLGFTIPEPS
jgi:aspartate carbamoyltransferase catalytic subunit